MNNSSSTTTTTRNAGEETDAPPAAAGNNNNNNNNNNNSSVELPSIASSSILKEESTDFRGRGSTTNPMAPPPTSGGGDDNAHHDQLEAQQPSGGGSGGGGGGGGDGGTVAERAAAFAKRLRVIQWSLALVGVSLEGSPCAAYALQWVLSRYPSGRIPSLREDRRWFRCNLAPLWSIHVVPSMLRIKSGATVMIPPSEPRAERIRVILIHDLVEKIFSMNCRKIFQPSGTSSRVKRS
jgi:hypothetical protein